MSENQLIDFLYPFIGYDIPLAVIDTTEAIWAESKRPQLHQKKRTKLGWEFYFTLPAGMSYRDFANKEEYYRDNIGDVTTEIQHIGKMALLKVITNKIGKKYLYEWNYKQEGVLPIPIGYTHEGLIVEDLARIYNMLIGGYIGGGKSNAIHVIVNSLLHITRPPKIIVIDFKLLEYNYLSNDVLLVTDQDTARKTLSRLVVEMRNRLITLQQAKCVNIGKYNEKYNNSMEYIVLVIDELAELKDEQSQEDLETLLRLCRASGIHIILATQRPDSKIFGSKSFGASKANLVGRLCFQVSDTVNSKIILDSGEAANLPNIPGRAIWKFGKTIELQVPYLDPDLAEAMLIEQPAKGSIQRQVSGGYLNRVGGDGYRPIANTVIPLLQSCTAKIKQIARAKKN